MTDLQTQDGQESQESQANPGFPYIEVGKMIIYSFTTLGFYLYIWLITRSDAINKMNSSKKVDKNIFVVLFIINVIDTIIYFSKILLRLNFRTYETISSLVWILSVFVFLFQIFKIRDIFEDHFNGYLKKNEEFSKAFTFLFNILYFQHKINKLCYNMKKFK